MKFKKLFIAALFWCTSIAFAQQPKPGIQLVKNGRMPQLLVNDKPFMILGGELGNSTASSIEYMRPYWKHLKEMNLNTVLAPVYWELLEPQENKFDFTLVDSLIANARNNDLKLVLLWFGTWKNSMSCYAPIWMKTNPAKFPRTQDKDRASQEIFSVFGKETLAADKKAFARLMKHLKEFDQTEKTVIMVQVENEMGMLPTAREFSVEADKLFNNKIPSALGKYLQQNKTKLVSEFEEKWKKRGYLIDETWSKVFGDDIATEEIFQAWYYASYANEVTIAGKKEYNLPMFVNAALPRRGKNPGEYPSAGPLPHLMNIWQAAAPDIDMFSPDFYNPDTKYWCDLYTRNGNILFIPEIRFDSSCAAKALYVIGHYKAIGFSPFSIESGSTEDQSLANSYHILHQLAPFIHNTSSLDMEGYLFEKGKGRLPQQTVMNKYQLTVIHDNTLPWSTGAMENDSNWPVTGGLIIQTAEDEFLIAGNGIVVTFKAADNNQVCNIASADEVEYKSGKEVFGRRMNGDQDHQGRHIRFTINDWGIQKVKLYTSPKSIEK